MTELSIQAAWRHALDPVAFAAEVLNFQADPWQASVLRSNASQVLICCSRQSGKSKLSAVAALHMALYRPGSLVLMVAPTQRQSTELLAKAGGFLRCVRDAKPEAESTISIKLASGRGVSKTWGYAASWMVCCPKPHDSPHKYTA